MEVKGKQPNKSDMKNKTKQKNERRKKGMMGGRRKVGSVTSLNSNKKFSEAKPDV